MARLRAIQADITTLKVDAIVNAANASLLGGGGVDGAIHRAAGPAFLQECRRLDGSNWRSENSEGPQTSSSEMIHAVDPVWHGGHRGEADPLASCYRRSLEIARESSLRSITFPSISAGAYGSSRSRGGDRSRNSQEIRRGRAICFRQGGFLLLFRPRPRNLCRIAQRSGATVIAPPEDSEGHFDGCDGKRSGWKGCSPVYPVPIDFGYSFPSRALAGSRTPVSVFGTLGAKLLGSLSGGGSSSKGR